MFQRTTVIAISANVTKQFFFLYRVWDFLWLSTGNHVVFAETSKCFRITRTSLPTFWFWHLSLTVLIVVLSYFAGEREQNRLQRWHQSLDATDSKSRDEGQRNAEWLEKERRQNKKLEENGEEKWLGQQGENLPVCSSSCVTLKLSLSMNTSYAV